MSWLNQDKDFHGIVTQLPFPPQINETEIIRILDPAKDVDGLHPYNAGLLAAGVPRFIPATPHGVQQMLIRTGNDPAGKHVVICGRSNIVGKPLAALLSQKRPGANATVTVCHTGHRRFAAIHPPGRCSGCRHGQSSRNQSGHGQGRLRGHRCWDQSCRGRYSQERLPTGGRRGLRCRVGSRQRHLTRARRRRPHDHRHAPGQHFSGGQ